MCQSITPQLLRDPLHYDPFFSHQYLQKDFKGFLPQACAVPKGLLLSTPAFAFTSLMGGQQKTIKANKTQLDEEKARVESKETKFPPVCL